jgi:hypothetical protein
MYPPDVSRFGLFRFKMLRDSNYCLGDDSRLGLLPPYSKLHRCFESRNVEYVEVLRFYEHLTSSRPESSRASGLVVMPMGGSPGKARIRAIRSCEAASPATLPSYSAAASV